MSSKLDQVQNVDIDSAGRFKYILVKISDGSREKYIVRGYRRAGYHGMSVFASARLLNLLYFVYIKLRAESACSSYWFFLAKICAREVVNVKYEQGRAEFERLFRGGGGGGVRSFQGTDPLL